MLNRIKAFHELTEPIVNYYQHFGKVRIVDGSGNVDKVYEKCNKAIHPNLIFFMGPPCVGKTETAKILHKKMGFHYVNLKEFFKTQKCKDEIDQNNKLMEFL